MAFFSTAGNKKDKGKAQDEGSKIKKKGRPKKENISDKTISSSS